MHLIRARSYRAAHHICSSEQSDPTQGMISMCICLCSGRWHSNYLAQANEGVGPLRESNGSVSGFEWRKSSLSMWIWSAVVDHALLSTEDAWAEITDDSLGAPVTCGRWREVRTGHSWSSWFFYLSFLFFCPRARSPFYVKMRCLWNGISQLKTGFGIMTLKESTEKDSDIKTEGNSCSICLSSACHVSAVRKLQCHQITEVDTCPLPYMSLTLM